jgi:hypothetical protein
MVNSKSILAILGIISAVGLIAGSGIASPSAAEAVQVNIGGTDNHFDTTPIVETLIADPNCGSYSSKLLGNV